jgi:hypothetical protein
MAMTSAALVLLHARLARSPEFAMTLASKMVANAFERHDLEGVDRWTRCLHELRTLHEEGSPSESPAARTR